jgi:Zn-dependent M28 family amino/carboxypeptidase
MQARVQEALFANERVTLAELKMQGDSARHMASFELRTPVTIRAQLWDSVLVRGYNVLAKLEGADPQLRNTYVTIAAHLDGAVSTSAVDGDSIYNAADDNASGSAGILAVAEQLARAPRPRRSIVFIWDSGEEIGLYGTRSFVGRPVVPLKDIVAHFNVDMIGATRAPGRADSASADVAGPNEVYVGGPRVLSASLDSLIRRTNRELLDMQLNSKYDRADHEFFYPRTDAGPFLERGVLSVDLFTGLHARYHRPQDEARHLDPKKIEAVSRTLLGIVWAVANTDAHSVPRIDKEMPTNVPRY